MNLSDDKKRFFERTMHTPDDEARAALRAALRDLSRILLPLHKALIDELRLEYSQLYEPVDQPTKLLSLLGGDPFFAWLKPVTALIVDIDEMASHDFEAADAVAIADRTDAMFDAASGSEFASRYIPILQRSVDVAIGHAALRGAVARLRS